MTYELFRRLSGLALPLALYLSLSLTLGLLCHVLLSRSIHCRVHRWSHELLAIALYGYTLIDHPLQRGELSTGIRVLIRDGTLG
jgi:hypothetical protein